MNQGHDFPFFSTSATAAVLVLLRKAEEVRLWVFGKGNRNNKIPAHHENDDQKYLGIDQRTETVNEDYFCRICVVDTVGSHTDKLHVAVPMGGLFSTLKWPYAIDYGKSI